MAKKKTPSNENTRMPLTSGDVTVERKDALRQLFPEVFAEGKIDFEKLKLVLGEEIDEGRERYGLTWAGKADAIRAIQVPSTGTLVPVREESVDFDSTENLMIEGDNLEVLKLLQKAYHGKIKMIYIDPPYNTGKEFIYPDNFREGLQDYLRYSGQVDGEGLKLTSNTETSGRYHSKWLSMMYPRLFLARNLLREDGVLVVHIDEHEQETLVLICKEVFGEENYLGSIVWDKGNPKGDARGIAYQHESIIVFARDASLVGDVKRPKANAHRILLEARKAMSRSASIEEARKLFAAWMSKQSELSGGEAMYNRLDEHGRVYRLVSMAWPNKKRAPDEYFRPLIHPVTGRPCPVPRRGWRYPPRTMQKLLTEGLIEFGPDDTTQPQRRYWLDENMEENVPSVIRFSKSDDALFQQFELPFANPKPVEFSAQVIQWFSRGTDVVMDFFAGSGTVGHAVWLANALDGSRRRLILVQLPEPTSRNDYPTIADITKARLRKAAEAIKKERNGKLDLNGSHDIDLGFRTYKLAASNFKIWEPGADAEEELARQLELYADNLVPGAKPEAVLYELMLKAGIPLTARVEKLELGGQEVFSIEGGLLFICLADPITRECIRAMIASSPQMVICLDHAFRGNDQLLTNTVLEMKSHGIHFRTV